MKAHVLYGPPGTGKTTRLCQIIEAHKELGQRLVVLSHTKAAAQEISARAPGVRSGTIHSFAFNLANCRRQSVVDLHKLGELSKITGVAISGARVTEDEATDTLVGDEYLSIYGLARARREPAPAVYEASHRPGSPQEYEYFYKAYEDWKSQRGFYDFADMLELAADRPLGASVLIVDEAQDLAPSQWALVRSWAKDSDRTFVAGDDDQAIFVWGGADAHGMSSFEADFAAVREVLGQSWRIPSVVHDLAAEIISPVRGRVDKDYRPRPERGVLERVPTVRGVEFIEDESTLILYRNHAIRRDVLEHLVLEGIPHIIDNGGFSYLQGAVADICRAWQAGTPFNLVDEGTRRRLNWVFTDRAVTQFEMTGEWPCDPLESPKVSWPVAAYLKKVRQRCPYGEIPHPKEVSIHLSSIHGAKGREADHVVLINGVAGRSLRAWETDQDNERRVYYVGVTRARKRLTIIQAENALEIL